MSDESSSGDESDTNSIPDPNLPGPAGPPVTAQKLAATAKDLDALRSTVVDAANVSGTLWVSYLFALFYLLIATAAVTHRQLFFEDGVKLPFLNVELPLKGFFWLGPLIFIILHAYVLLHFVLLAGKVGEFHRELESQIVEDDIRARIRRQLPSNIFVQFLAGAREIRHGLIGWMLRLIAWISLIIGPVTLLVFFQLQFLPYHDEAITWWQRVAVVIDLALLWLVWPAVALGTTVSGAWRLMSRRRIIASAVVSLLPVMLVFGIATFPGEAWHGVPPSPRFIPSRDASAARTWHMVSPHEFLFAGQPDLVTGRPTSLFSNVLVLPGLVIRSDTPAGGERRSGARDVTASLRGRRLEGAILIGADLRRVDFTGAQMQAIQLARADLRGARLGCQGRDYNAFSSATDFRRDCAQLQGASAYDADLRGAMLENAQLQGALLARTRLEGTSLEGAALDGAWLMDAELFGASLSRARLRGALLGLANLWGSDLSNADLRGANLNEASLGGALLVSAQLQGALLDDAWLGGASLKSADLRGASINAKCVWRADARQADGLVQARLGMPRTEVGVSNDKDKTRTECRWNDTSVQKLRTELERRLPEGELRTATISRLTSLLSPGVPLPEEQAMAAYWRDSAATPPQDDVWSGERSKAWQEAVCDADGTPYVLRGLLVGAFLRQPPPWQRDLAKAMLDPATCAGNRDFTARDKARLAAIRDAIAATGSTR